MNATDPTDCAPCVTSADARSIERRARRDLGSVLTVSSGDGDVWGWAMQSAFAVCDLMSLAGVSVPAELDYSPAPGLDWPTGEDEDGEDLTLGELIAVWSDYSDRDPEAADAALTYWARVLCRYMDLPAVQARAY